MIGGNSSTRTRTYYFRWFPESIPDELLFEILVRLPALDIYFGARFVCRKWYHMTHTKYFIHEHLEHASYGLLYKDKSGNLVFSSAREDGGGTVDTYKLNYKTRLPVSSSWNGLTLECERPRNGFVYRFIKNVLTDQSFPLHPCPYLYPSYWLCGIEYDATSTTYKVVASYMEKSGKYGCAILTFGVDKTWRIVPTDHLSFHGKRTIMSRPIITEGFVHWKTIEDRKVVTLDLRTEIVKEIPPPEVEEENTRHCCLSTGRYLSLFVWRGRLAWEVFEMKPEIGEWRKFADICLEGQQGKIIPFGWLKYPEVLALIVDYKVIIFYNLITREIGTETLSTRGDLATLHKNSLEWLGGP